MNTEKFRYLYSSNIANGVSLSIRQEASKLNVMIRPTDPPLLVSIFYINVEIVCIVNIFRDEMCEL